MTWTYPFPVGEVMKRGAAVAEKYAAQDAAKLARLSEHRDEQRRQKLKLRCIYCGASTSGARTCGSHQDLLTLERY